MALKTQSLGRAAAGTTRCLTCSGTTNTTPIVATFGAGHGFKDNDRIALANITGNTNANGVWTLKSTGTNTFQLLGSSGNGTHGGTAKVGVVMDRTPFMKNHSAVLSLTGNLVGEVQIESFASYADFAAGNNADGGATAPALTNTDINNTAGNASSIPASSYITQAATTAGMEVEIKLGYIMSAITTSTYTSGTVAPVICA